MSREIPFVNLSAQWDEEKDDLLPIIERVMANGVFVGGDEVANFESLAADFCGVQHCVAVNSGTDALVCALKALGVSRGDEVITPPNSFVASTAAIIHIGAVPVFSDVLENQNIDPKEIEASITSKTKVIMPVHLTGRMANMEAIMEIAERHGIFVVEDAAQSIGSSFDGKMSGAYGHVGCFSTHPLKNLNSCGDGGFITTNNAAIAESVKSMRNHGMLDRNTVEAFGYVSRMDTLQAAILTHRISRLPEVIERRRANANVYYECLDAKNVFVPDQDIREFNTFHTFIIQVDRRDALSEFLRTNGVQTAIHYPVPIHLQPAAKSLGYNFGDFHVTEKQAGRILTLPIHQFIGGEQITRVAKLINDFYGA